MNRIYLGCLTKHLFVNVNHLIAEWRSLIVFPCRIFATEIHFCTEVGCDDSKFSVQIISCRCIGRSYGILEEESLVGELADTEIKGCLRHILDGDRHSLNSIGQSLKKSCHTLSAFRGKYGLLCNFSLLDLDPKFRIRDMVFTYNMIRFCS